MTVRGMGERGIKLVTGNEFRPTTNDQRLKTDD
jgi:hypothetical protein